MITVKEALSMPELCEAVVRAGKNGLGRNIHWAHVIDHSDIGYFLEGGELLLTCGQIWPEDPDEQTRNLNLFLNHQISGIVFATGRFLNECPELALEFGRKYAIPIIEVPFQIPFVKVTRNIHQEIMKRQYKKIELASHIPLQLTDKLKEAATFLEVCETLTENLKCPILLSDSHHKIIARSFPSGASINLSKITQELNATLSGFMAPHPKKLEDKLESGAPNQSFPIGKMEGETTIITVSTDSLHTFIGIPIQNEEDYFGTLWAVDPSEQGRKDRISMLEHGTAILREIIERKKDREAKRRQLQAELLELLLKKPKIASILVEEKMLELGVAAKEKWLAGILPFSKEDSFTMFQDVQANYELCQRWLEETPDAAGFCEQYEGSLVLILTFNCDQAHLEEHLKMLQIILNENMTAALLLGGIKREPFSLKESYQEAELLASIIPNDRSTQDLYFADQYRRELLLYSSIGSIQAQKLRAYILPKELMDEGEILYDTLKCLMLNQFNRERTANLLHIHRNTLRYRIEKIETLLGDSLTSLRCQFWLQIAFDLEPLAIAK